MLIQNCFDIKTRFFSSFNSFDLRLKLFENLSCFEVQHWQTVTIPSILKEFLIWKYVASFQKPNIQCTFVANFLSWSLGKIRVFLSQLYRELNTALLFSKMCINKYFAVWVQQYSIYFGRAALLSREDLDPTVFKLPNLVCKWGLGSWYINTHCGLLHEALLSGLCIIVPMTCDESKN